MQINKLQGFVLLLVLVGMILGIGVLVLDKFSVATRDTTTAISTGVNFSTGTSLDLATEYCIAATSIGNGTSTFSLTTYNVTLTDTEDCIFEYSAIPACTSPLCNITYTYGADTTAATSTINVVSAITPIASTWLPLLVTIAILSIILTLVISSFAMKRR